MGFYVITNGKGSYIRKDETSGKYVPIKNFKQAMQWDSITKANAVLNNSIAKSVKSGYEMQLIETEKVVEKEDLSIPNEICFREIIDDNIQDWITKINEIAKLLQGSGERKEELLKKLSDVDKEIVDIEHYIEFGKFNAYQGWMCFKMLQNLLQQRRKYKNEISVLNLIKQCDFNTDSIIALSQTISDIQNKCYKPRAFPELFMGSQSND